MFDTDGPFVLLDDRLGHAAGARVYRRPVEVHACHTLQEVMALNRRLDDARRDGLHAAGCLAYELGYLLEPRLADRAPAKSASPLAWLGLFEAPERLSAAEIDAALGELAPPPPITAIRLGHTREQHMAKVGQIRELIAAGDLYQANLTFPITFDYDGAPLSLFAALRARQPVSHGALAWTGQHWLLSLSPELFFETTGQRITARPMKGTCPRGATPAEDDLQALALAQDPKQRAENLMIVDLLRNDVSRVATPGSVRASALFSVETYPTFHAMTSTVSGQLRPDTSLGQILAALFPCGSVVGAPRIRAAEVIGDLETEPRGVYCGAIGAIEPNGDMRFGVAIRTAVLDAAGRGRYGVGGGVVADSVPCEEFDEAVLKARVLTDLAEPYQLIETLRWEPRAGFVRLDRHLARLAHSAAALGFLYAGDDVAARLEDAVAGLAEPARARAVLHRDGRLEVAATPLGATDTEPLHVLRSTEVLDAADPFLRHKTSRRTQHERAFAAAAAAGAREALLLNTRGKVADGARSSIFLRRDGRLLTPPTSSGALPGVLRAELIARGEAVEAELSVADLAAGPFLLGSSLRGLRPATLDPRG